MDRQNLDDLEEEKEGECGWSSASKRESDLQYYVQAKEVQVAGRSATS